MTSPHSCLRWHLGKSPLWNGLAGRVHPVAGWHQAEGAHTQTQAAWQSPGALQGSLAHPLPPQAICTGSQGSLTYPAWESVGKVSAPLLHV